MGKTCLNLLSWLHRSMQFSSLGSLDEKWMAEFASSLSSGVSEDKSLLGPGDPLIIWPTVEDVRCSLEVLSTVWFSSINIEISFFVFIEFLSLCSSSGIWSWECHP